MSRLMLIAVLSIGCIVTAHTQNSNAEGSNFIADKEAIGVTQGAGLGRDSSDPISGIDSLRTHSGRFEKAIRLIETEAAKPNWGWDDGCDHLESQAEASVNW
jgi:type IV secretory pathway TrbF-like protein